MRIVLDWPAISLDIGGRHAMYYGILAAIKDHERPTRSS